MNKFAVSVVALVLASAVSASDHKVFQWSPADLATLEGIVATHERVEAKAREFCTRYLRGTRGVPMQRGCLDAVTAEIVASVDDARLTAYAETGKVDEALLARR